MSLELIRINPDGERVQFRPDAARSFRRMERQQGRQLDVNRTVVTYDVQDDLYQKRLRGEYPYPVAPPWESDHVYRSDTDGGCAWDTDERGDWLEENGWVITLEEEQWHRVYRIWLDRHITDPDPEQKDDDMQLPLVITVGIPAPAPAGQEYYSVDLAARTKARIHNGTELDWRRNLGIQEYTDQSPAVLVGYTEIGVVK